MIKCIASDLDGTLLYQGKLSDNNLKAIKLLEKNNILFVIATGRNLQELELLDLRGVRCPKVMGNGPLVVDEDNNIISMTNIGDAALRKVIAVLDKYDIGYMFYTAYKRYVVKYDQLINSFDTDRSVFGLGFFNNVERVNGIEDINFPICKIEVMDGKNFDLISLIRKQIEQIDGVYATSSNKNNIEIIVKGGNKYNGLVELMEKYKFNKDELAVFGDSDNDFSMFENVYESYAMGNANDLIKAHAKHITLDCKDDGFYHSVLKIIENN